MQTEPPQPFVTVRNDEPQAARLSGAVVAIGNFDGVHRGHRAVIAAAMARARSLGKPAAALTLEPHPRQVFQPQVPLFRLTDEANKLRLFAAAGLDGAIVLTFDKALASLPAEDFVGRILVERFAISGAAIGFDFHFGRNRGGSPDFLKAEGARRGFAVDIVPPLEDHGGPISSGAIRAALGEGDIALANALLGHPWFVTAAVIHGDKRGRTLGYPTANMRLDPACGLRHGIYAVRVRLDAGWRDAVASFGRRPTFDDGAPRLEVFVFDFAGDLYGRILDVAFIAFLRPELKFEALEPLIRQMDDDSRHARAALAADPAVPPLG